MNRKLLLKRGFLPESIVLDGYSYQIYKKQTVHCNIEAPRLVVVSYLPSPETVKLLKLCIATIKKYTLIPYELWVVDNNSPFENIKWLVEEEGINVILNRTDPKEKGSYANAIGLEMAAACVSPETKYFMTLHQDIAVCRYGWLSYLLSKLDDRVKAAGVRLDTARVKDGILHVLGYLIDFQIFKKLNLSFYPDLPHYDVGDKAIVDIKESGFEIFAFPNTLWDKTLIENISEASPYRSLNVDRSFDDEHQIFFLHLGRGVEKSLGTPGHVSSERSIEIWDQFITKNLLNSKDNIEIQACFNFLTEDPWYSVRRYYVDEFYFRYINMFKPHDKIIDMGGKKKNKRGRFDIEKYNLNVKYANLSEQTEPDYLCDICSIPVESGIFDGVILSEVLEHVPDPKAVLQEAYRVLKKGGKALICTPFMYHVHADPYDFGRYTDYYYRQVLQEIGFKSIIVEKQGLFFSVLAHMLKLWAYELSLVNRPKNWIIKKVFHRLVYWFVKNAVKLEKGRYYQENWMFSGYTTGYGIICYK